jgi:hypothetical protein
VIPLLRKQRGFLDRLILPSDGGQIFYVYSFWANSEDAEKHDCAALPLLTRGSWQRATALAEASQ